jgi:hypothetical protein
MKTNIFLSFVVEPEYRSQCSDWLRAGRPRGRSSSPGKIKDLHFSLSYRVALGPTQPPIQRVSGAPSPRVKRLGREADHSPPANAEVKKMWIHTSTPPYVFMAQCLISSYIVFSDVHTANHARDFVLQQQAAIGRLHFKLLNNCTHIVNYFIIQLISVILVFNIP